MKLQMLRQIDRPRRCPGRCAPSRVRLRSRLAPLRDNMGSLRRRQANRNAVEKASDAAEVNWNAGKKASDVAEVNWNAGEKTSDVAEVN